MIGSGRMRNGQTNGAGALCGNVRLRDTHGGSSMEVGGPGVFEKYSKAEDFCEGFNNLENDYARSGHLRWQCFKPAAVDDDEIKKSRRAGCLDSQNYVDHKSVCNTHVLVHCLVVHCKWPSSRNTMDEEVAWRWLTPMRRTTEEEGFLRTGFLRIRSGYYDSGEADDCAWLCNGQEADDWPAWQKQVLEVACVALECEMKFSASGDTGGAR